MRDERLRIRTSGLSWREVNGEIIALDLESSSYFTTNRSGALMWHRLVGGASRDDLVDALVTTFDLTDADVTGDVDAFITMLREHRLLE